MGGTDGTDINEAYKMLEAFNESRLGTASARIADVARDHTYTIIADPDHRNAAPYELVANPQTMSALANAGVKHIGVEKFFSENPTFEAYARGELSDRTMEYAMTDMGPPSLLEVYGGQKNPDGEMAYFDLVKNARAYGIAVHAVDGAEGSAASLGIEKDDLDAALTDMGNMKLAGLRAIESHPEFFDLSRREQGDFMTKALYEAGYDDDQVVSGLTYMGFRKGEVVAGLDMDQAVARLAEDPMLAQRIADVSGGEKTVVIYGQGHFLRHYGDVDANLPGSAVIDVYADKDSINPLAAPVKDDLGQRMGQPFTDVGDYDLDLGKGIWTNNATGTAARVAMPELPSIPGGTAPPQRPLDIQERAAEPVVPELAR